MSLPRAEASRLRQVDPLSNAVLAIFTALSTSAFEIINIERNVVDLSIINLI